MPARTSTRQTLTIWCNASFPPDAEKLLQQGVTPHRLIRPESAQESNLTAAGHDPTLEQADIAFGQPNPNQLLDDEPPDTPNSAPTTPGQSAAQRSAAPDTPNRAHAGANLPKLKWIHLTSAGYSRYDAEVFRAEMRRRSAILTNSSSVYAEPCAQHVLAMMLALARQLPQALDEQRSDRAWNWKNLRNQSHLLTGQSALLVGYGAIARRLVELLSPLRMNLTAVRRSVRGDENVRTIALDQCDPVPQPENASSTPGQSQSAAPGHLPIEQNRVDALLSSADHVINLLPASPSTNNFFNAARLDRLKPGAIYYSIGRGGTTDQDALLAALNEHRIAGAYLDVTTPEPLPPDDPLWSAPNCHITPHTAGGHADEHERIVRHFLDNLRRYEHTEPLNDRIM